MQHLIWWTFEWYPEHEGTFSHAILYLQIKFIEFATTILEKKVYFIGDKSMCFR